MASGSKGMGMHKHGVSGRTPKSPKFRANMKREAEASTIKDKKTIKDPASSVDELVKKTKIIR